jgi:hypothetical protein
VIDGVGAILSRHERVIVLEDDLVTSPYFLDFMNGALDRYEGDDRVASIHGYVYPTKKRLPDLFFLRGADCWGWATWRRGWALFREDGRALLSELEERGLIDLFDFRGTYPYSGMLKNQIAGLNSSWAVRWYASAFLAEKLTLYPGRSLVFNIGNDLSGRHTGNTKRYDTALADGPIPLAPILVEDHPAARLAFESFFRSLTRLPPLSRLARKIRSLLGKRKA